MVTLVDQSGHGDDEPRLPSCRACGESFRTSTFSDHHQQHRAARLGGGGDTQTYRCCLACEVIFFWHFFLSSSIGSVTGSEDIFFCQIKISNNEPFGFVYLFRGTRLKWRLCHSVRYHHQQQQEEEKEEKGEEKHLPSPDKEIFREKDGVQGRGPPRLRQQRKARGLMIKKERQERKEKGKRGIWERRFFLFYSLLSNRRLQWE